MKKITHIQLNLIVPEEIPPGEIWFIQDEEDEEVVHRIINVQLPLEPQSDIDQAREAELEPAWECLKVLLGEAIEALKSEQLPRDPEPEPEP